MFKFSQITADVALMKQFDWPMTDALHQRIDAREDYRSE